MLYGEVFIQSAKHQFSAHDILKYFFLIFPREQDLIFHANCLQQTNKSSERDETLHYKSDKTFDKCDSVKTFVRNM